MINYRVSISGMFVIQKPSSNRNDQYICGFDNKIKYERLETFEFILDKRKNLHKENLHSKLNNHSKKETIQKYGCWHVCSYLTLMPWITFMYFLTYLHLHVHVRQPCASRASS